MLAPVLVLAMMQQANLPLPGLGSALYEQCQATIRLQDAQSGTAPEYQKSAFCTAYLDGIIDGLNGQTTVICYGSGASLVTMARIYVAYMQKNPKLMDRNKAVGAVFALLDAYPCPAK